MPKLPLKPLALLPTLLLPACWRSPANPNLRITLFDRYPFLSDMLFALVGAALLALLYYFFFKSGKRAGSAFVISVDGPDIQFSGNLPESKQPLIEDFLKNDCPVEGPYEITGRWDQRILVIEVRGQNARFVTQRIRNFLKLHLKPPLQRSEDEDQV